MKSVAVPHLLQQQNRKHNTPAATLPHVVHIHMCFGGPRFVLAVQAYQVQMLLWSKCGVF